MSTAETTVTTKRIVMGHVVLCRGCCCGEVNKGKPEVPVELLKRQWRERGLMKHIQLTISGCLGPCDVSNVLSISDSNDHIWLGKLHNPGHYTALIEWAARSKEAGRLLPLPVDLNQLRFDPFRTTQTIVGSQSVGLR